LLHLLATACSEDFSPFKKSNQQSSFVIAFQLIVRLWQLVFLSIPTKEQFHYDPTIRPRAADLQILQICSPAEEKHAGSIGKLLFNIGHAISE
jgi:hypothetical protein